jgi:CRISPR-associated protein Csb1
MGITWKALTQAVAEDAAFRRRRRLQPAGGVGDKLFPPTYPGEIGRNPPPQHVFERRHIDGKEVWCVLLDSVQSQANRLEEALLEAAKEKRIALPYLSVDFASAGFNSIGEITSLDAPHRIFDAILRDSLLDGTPFRESEVGKSLEEATARDATAILEASPTALLFGVWNSTGEGGGIGAKFPRAIVSEIVGIDVPVEDGATDARTGEVQKRTSARRTSSRIDPLGIVRAVEIYKGQDGWDVTEEGAGDKAKRIRPSEIIHGNIRPSVDALGITCAYAQQIAVITLAGLRRLRFGNSAERDVAARALIAALGLVALVEQDAQGYALRSRCDLVCEGDGPLEKVAFDGSVNTMTLSSEEAVDLYKEAYAKALDAGFALDEKPVRLDPQDKLQAIVKDSMKRAISGEGDADETE